MGRRFLSIRLRDIPESRLPAILEIDDGRHRLVLVEKVDAQTFQVEFSDGRQSPVSARCLEKTYQGRCALSPLRPSSSSTKDRPGPSTLQQLASLLADNPWRVASGLFANGFVIALALTLMKGIGIASLQLSAKPMALPVVILAMGLLVQGVSDLRLLMDVKRRRSNHGRLLYPSFSPSCATFLVDCAVLPISLFLVQLAGGFSFSVPLLSGILGMVFLYIHTDRIEPISSLARQWAGRFRWVGFYAILAGSLWFSNTADLTLGKVALSLVLVSLSLERFAHAAGLARGFRLAHLGVCRT